MSKQGSNSELFAHKNDALTAQKLRSATAPQIYKYKWYLFPSLFVWYIHQLGCLFKNRRLLEEIQ